MKGLRKSLAVIVAAVLLLALVPAVALAGEDTLTGTFSVNSPPSITSVTLWNISGPDEVAAMTPQVEFDARVKVTDVDGLTDLDTIVVAIWYDSDGGVPTSGEFDAIVAGTGNAQTAIFITWTDGGTFVLTEETDSSWDLGTGVVGTADSATAFQFKFTVGKVATETAVGLWQIAAKVTDDSTQSAWAADAEGATMAWYGEVTIGPGEVDFGSLTAGTAFAECTPQTVYDTSGVNYIANGAYDEQVKATSSWDAATLYTIDTDPGSMPADNFSLKADDTAVLGTAVMVDTTGATIDDTGIQTTEDGGDVVINTLWIQLASSFTAGDYNGSIYYIIADGA